MAAITKFREKNEVLEFTLSNVDKCYANGIRRTLLSDIPCVVLDNCVFTKNTTRLHNEIMKQRFSCIPVYLTDVTKNYEHLIVELNETNTSQDMQILTSGHLKIKEGDRYWTEAEVQAVFPADPYTHDYIELARLRPSISATTAGESMQMTCTFRVGTAKENGSFNVVSISSYGFTPDPILGEQEWKKKGIEDASEKENWDLLDAKRYVIPNSYDMMIETVGVYSNTDLVLMACDVVIQSIKEIVPPVIVEGDSTMLHCYDVVMDIDYTVGKMIEYELYTHLFGKTITYVTFYKKHPHDTTSILRITCMEETPLEKLQEYLQAAYTMCISVLQDIQVKIRAL